jgi:hypothetical protein
VTTIGAEEKENERIDGHREERRQDASARPLNLIDQKVISEVVKFTLKELRAQV